MSKQKKNNNNNNKNNKSNKLSAKEKFHVNFQTNLFDPSYTWSDVKKSWMTEQEKQMYNTMLKYKKDNQYVAGTLEDIDSSIRKTVGFQQLERALQSTST